MFFFFLIFELWKLRERIILTKIEKRELDGRIKWIFIEILYDFFFSVINFLCFSIKHHLIVSNENIQIKKIKLNEEFFKNFNDFLCIHHIAKSINYLHQQNLSLPYSSFSNNIYFEVEKKINKYVNY